MAEVFKGRVVAAEGFEKLVAINRILPDLAGMGVVTPALPSAHLDAAPQMPPRSSQAAVDAGVLLGYAGMVERLVAGLLATAGGPAQVVVTGGNAPRLMRHARLRAVSAPDLVHQGLRALAEQSACGC